MIIKRKNIDKIIDLIKNLGSKKFDIHLQYKFIKLKKALEEETEIYQEQLKSNCEQFFARDDKGNPIIDDNGGYKIDQNKINECYNVIGQLNKMEVSIPDLYISLDELEPLDLTFEQLELLEPFIK